MSDLINQLLQRVDFLEKNISSIIKPEVGRWLDWTPTVTQNVAVAVTVDYAEYILRDSMVVATAHLTVSGAGTAGNAIVIGGLPYANGLGGGITNGRSCMGFWILRNSNVPLNYCGSVEKAVDATKFYMRDSGTVGSGIGQDPNVGLSNGDTIGFTIIYKT